jgi:hypothetical protein
MRILPRHSETHRNRCSSNSFSELASDDGREIQARSLSRPIMGASEMNDRRTSFRTISGDVSNEDTVRGVADGVEATVCKMSPIWEVS